jgi:hypothetical protein
VWRASAWRRISGHLVMPVGVWQVQLAAPVAAPAIDEVAQPATAGLGPTAGGGGVSGKAIAPTRKRTI